MALTFSFCAKFVRFFCPLAERPLKDNLKHLVRLMIARPTESFTNQLDHSPNANGLTPNHLR